MNETVTQQKMLKRVVKDVLEGSHVPLKYYMKVVESLRQALAENDSDRKEFWFSVESFKKDLNGFLEHTELEREGLLALLNTHSEELRKSVATIKEVKNQPGIPGEPGQPGEPGKDGVMPPIDVLVRAVLDRMPKPKEEKTPKETEKSLVEAVIKEIQKGDKLHINHVKGAGSFMKDGIKYRFEELMHGGGSVVRSYDLSSQCDGSNKTFTIPTFTRIITLIATDAPIIYRPTTDFTATGVTLTMTAAVNAPSSGATLMLTYV